VTLSFPALVARTVDQGRTASRGAILCGPWAEVKEGMRT